MLRALVVLVASGCVNFDELSSARDASFDLLDLDTSNRIAHDDFHRQDRPGWGTASDGQTWGNNANLSFFSIVSETGEIAAPDGNYDATLGPDVADVEVIATGSIDHLDDQAHLGALVRYGDAANFYELTYRTRDLELVKRVGDRESTLLQASRIFTPYTLYTFRFRAVGSTLWGKIWQADQLEPTGWDFTFTDFTLPHGHVGVRASFSTAIPDAGAPSTTVKLTAFDAFRS